MRGGFGAAALLAALLLTAGQCNLTGGTTQTANRTTATTPTPSPSPSPTAPLVIGNLRFHNGEVGFGYAAITLGASGGTAPYTWSIAAGTFPPGLSLSPDGAVSGSNTTAGAFGFTVSVSDSGGQSTTAPAKVNVYATIAVTQLCAARCSIGAGCTRCGGFATVRAGLGPYSYRISRGAIPPGMTWNALSLNGPFPQGAYSMSVLVTDSAGGSATASANWSVYGPATLSKAGDCIDTKDYPPFCNVRWTYSGGHPSVAPKLVILGYLQNCNAQGVCSTPTLPPPGWKVSVAGGVVNISAAGSGCVTSYIGTVRMALVDTTTCATSQRSNEQDLKVDLEYSC